MKKPISDSLSENLEELENRLELEKNFDIVKREFKIGNKDAGLIFLDGFLQEVDFLIPFKYLIKTKREHISVNAIKKIINKRFPFFEMYTLDSYEDIIDEMLSGPQILFLDGYDEAIVIDSRGWQSRSPDEPELEKTTRGPADGFVETMLFNVTAVRRRIRDPNLRVDALQVGERAKNDVSLLYIDDVVDKGLVEDVKKKLEKTKIDGLPLGDRTVEDIITDGSLNPFPKVRYTERPDNVAAHILEGNLAIIVDNSPTALILPAPFLSHVQTLEIYRKGTIIGSYFSSMRLLAMLVSVFIPVLWFLIATNQELIPDYLGFIGVREEPTIGVGLQFILASLGIDFIRMASIQVPSAMATSLSLIGALLLGEFAVEIGLFSPEIILYMAVAAIGNFAIPGYELALSLKLVRLILLVAAIVANITGFLIALIVIGIYVVFTKSFGIYYLWPIIPFDYEALKGYFINQSIFGLSSKRPAFTPDDQDKTRIDKEHEND